MLVDYIVLNLGNGIPTFFLEIVANSSSVHFCGCFIVFVCLSLLFWRLDVDLIVSVLSSFIYFIL